LGEKAFFTSPKKFVVSIQNAVERKGNTLKIKFLHTTCHHEHNFPKLIEKNELSFLSVKQRKIKILDLLLPYLGL